MTYEWHNFFCHEFPENVISCQLVPFRMNRLIYCFNIFDFNIFDLKLNHMQRKTFAQTFYHYKHAIFPRFSSNYFLSFPACMNTILEFLVIKDGLHGLKYGLQFEVR